MFGIEKGDWEQYLQLRSLTTVKEESMEEREHQLLYGEGNQFGIYQLKKSPELRELRFENMDFLKSRGLSVNKDNYELIYTAPLEEGVGLEDIFETFNLYHPADYKGHSLSVSDIVVLHKEGENTSHFVDSFGYVEVPEFLQEMIPEKQAEKTSVIKETPVEEADSLSYYVIEDISTWAENKPEKSKLERFDSFREALEQFKVYREKYTQADDKTRTTLGFRVHGSEFDVLYVRNNENILSLDFTHSSKALQSNRFIDDLQILCNELVDKVRVYREMTPEEVKAFVKERFKFKLESSGLDDIDMYMSRFDTLYEQGKMEHLMPSVNQKRIVEYMIIRIFPFMQHYTTF